MVKVQNCDGQFIQCRALLDTCASANFITEGLAARLKLRMKNCFLPIGGINSTTTTTKNIVDVTFQATQNSFRRTLSFLTIPKITGLTPAESFPRELIKIPNNIQLADPEFHLPKPVQLLIGSSPTISMLSVGRINLSQPNYEFLLQKTVLGWVASGCAAPDGQSKLHTCQLINLEKQIKKFWELEEIILDKPKNNEDVQCEEYFLKTIRRESDGRYIVRLPFRDESRPTGDSFSIARKRLYALEKKFESLPVYKTEYSEVLEEYIKLNHMTTISNPSIEGFYFPHHGVRKMSSTTTKLRVVFDASAKSDVNKSLNELLLTGPTIQDTIFIQLIKFRFHKYVLTADIEKMYRQVLLHEEDRIYQRILWRVGEKITTFQLNTLTFGVSSSPFLAIRTIHKLADDEAHDFPNAAKVLKNDLYVDDLLTGENTLESARILRNEIIKLLARGKFNIRQWASNDPQLLDDLPESNINAHILLDKDNTLKTLGVYWDATHDLIRYSVKSIELPPRITKRHIISEIAKIYDPLGLLSPVILHAKSIMQQLWKEKIDWDESVTLEIHTSWCTFVKELDSLNNISFERRIVRDAYADIQIHGFCDASMAGYGACLYLRSSILHGETVSRLVCAKSRVTPIKNSIETSIPRLELCGALLLVRLYEEAIKAFNFSPSKVIFWSDSTIVLHWIKTPPQALKTYVANRVIEIQEKSDGKIWRHVRSEDNPADSLSRGQSPRMFLKNHMWAKGPTWLCQDDTQWPEGPQSLLDKSALELKNNVCLSIQLNMSDAVTTENKPNFWLDVKNYRSLLWSIVYTMRLLKRQFKDGGNITADEYTEAEIKLMKSFQAVHFPDIIQEIKKYGQTKKKKASVLAPFIDDEGVLRVGGRLRKASIPYAQKHPILLPSRNHLSDLIIKYFHVKNLHTGIQGTLHAIRTKFWICDGKNQVRKIVYTCKECRRFNVKPVNYIMSDLPQVRITSASPFENVGMDYCGPFFVKEKKFRNRGKVKIYVCVFVCMVVKAVHLEVVSDMTTDGFLGAFRRFIARRGTPKNTYSDNGTNFVGASNQLKELYDLFKTKEHKNAVNNFALGVLPNPIKWHFIPPLTPHQGGLWESTVKLFKHHLKRVVGDSLFTYEQFETFTIEIEGILNSRPLTPLSSDPNDLSVLTPAHILIGRPVGKLPEPEFDLRSTPSNRLSAWQTITKTRQDFWHRWHVEYLHEQQQRRKWVTNESNVEVETLVLIKDKNTPCLQWPLGRIIAVHPGDDGVVRTATVKTAHGEFKRSVKSLCPLPIDE